MRIASAIAAAVTICSIAIGAQAAPPLVNPVSFQVGTTLHLTPVDQNAAPIPITQCTFLQMPPQVTWVKDATGFVLSAAMTTNGPSVQISCGDGVNPAVKSSFFAVTVTPAPYAVTAVGSTSP